MEDMNAVIALCERGNSELRKSTRDLNKCSEIFNQLKVELTNLMFFPIPNNTASKEKLLIVRDILELGVKWSVAVKDITSFERYMTQLKCYYFDYVPDLRESGRKYEFLGLNLMFLLSQNRVAEFHTELELIPSDVIETNTNIKFPLNMEKYLMEGSYNEILFGRWTLPDITYNFFMDILWDTVRNEIAACMECAYDQISVLDAFKMLSITKPNELKTLALKRNWNWPEGDLYKSNFYFTIINEKKAEEPIPSSDLATLAIDYAKELEMIV
ncbi:regulatory particle non-ATPase 12 [Augochlora pura]